MGDRIVLRSECFWSEEVIDIRFAIEDTLLHLVFHQSFQRPARAAGFQAVLEIFSHHFFFPGRFAPLLVVAITVGQSVGFFKSGEKVLNDLRFAFDDLFADSEKMIGRIGAGALEEFLLSAPIVGHQVAHIRAGVGLERGIDLALFKQLDRVLASARRCNETHAHIGGGGRWLSSAMSGSATYQSISLGGTPN